MSSEPPRPYYNRSTAQAKSDADNETWYAKKARLKDSLGFGKAIVLPSLYPGSASDDTKHAVIENGEVIQ